MRQWCYSRRSPAVQKCGQQMGNQPSLAIIPHFSPNCDLLTKWLSATLTEEGNQQPSVCRGRNIHSRFLSLSVHFSVVDHLMVETIDFPIDDPSYPFHVHMPCVHVPSEYRPCKRRKCSLGISTFCVLWILVYRPKAFWVKLDNTVTNFLTMQLWCQITDVISSNEDQIWGRVTLCNLLKCLSLTGWMNIQSELERTEPHHRFLRLRSRLDVFLMTVGGGVAPGSTLKGALTHAAFSLNQNLVCFTVCYGSFVENETIAFQGRPNQKVWERLSEMMSIRLKTNSSMNQLRWESESTLSRLSWRDCMYVLGCSIFL